MIDTSTERQNTASRGVTPGMETESFVSAPMPPKHTEAIRIQRIPAKRFMHTPGG